MHVLSRRRPALVLAAVALGSAGLVLLTPATAAPSPASLDVYVGGGGPASASWTGGPIAGNPDPLGPPSPVCAPGQCERETLTVHASPSFAAANDLTLTVTVTFADPSGGVSTDDVAILDDKNDVIAGNGGATPVTVSGLVDPGTYTVEIDGDISLGEPSYSATATLTASHKVALPQHPSGSVRFARETLADPFRLGTEPSVVVGPKGTIYESPIFGFSTTQSFVQRSDDGGRTFNVLGVPGVGKPTECTGGGDSAMATDPNDDLYFIDLSGAPTVPASISTDHGTTFQSNCLANDMDGANVFTDRQWLSTDTVHGVEWYIYRDGLVNPNGPVDDLNHHVYGEYIKSAPLAASPGSASAITQLDFASLCKDSTGVVAESCIGDVGTAGPAITDNSPASPYRGTTYLPMATSGGVKLAVINPTTSFPDALKTSPHVAERVVDASTENHPVSPVLFPTVAVDRAGILYAAWTDASTYQLLVARSSDQGTTWTTPVAVNGDPVATTVMPWIVAGDKGRVDLAFYGSPVKQSPTINYGPWDLYMLQDLNADKNLEKWTQTGATDRPNHVEPICLSGLGCTTNTGPGGDRELGDFFSVALDKDGRAVISFADGNNGLGKDVANGPLAAPSFADNVVQAGGPSLYAAVGSVPPVPVPSDEVRVGPHSNPIPFAGPTAPGASDAALELRDSKVTYGTDGNLHVHLEVANLDPAAATNSPALPVATYLTRWWFGGQWYYAAAETNVTGQWSYFSGHVAPVSDGLAIKYAYHPASTSEQGTVATGANGTIDITVPPSHVGSPKTGDTLYSVTAYALTHALPTAPTPPTASNFTDFPQIADSLPAYNTDANAVVGNGNNGNNGGGGGNGGGGAGTGLPNTSSRVPSSATAVLALIAVVTLAVVARRRRREVRLH